MNGTCGSAVYDSLSMKRKFMCLLFKKRLCLERLGAQVCIQLGRNPYISENIYPGMDSGYEWKSIKFMKFLLATAVKVVYSLARLGKMKREW